MTTLCVELLNGRTLLGNSDNKMFSSYSFKLKNVVELIEGVSGEEGTDVKIMLVPYKPYTTAQEITEIPVTAVATFTSPTKDIQNEYDKAFSGIIQEKKELIL